MIARYLLDTNIASYLVRGGNPALQSRVAAVPPASLCISAITEAELRYGLARRPGNEALTHLIDELLARLEVLAWDSAAAQAYGTLRAELERCGTPLGNLDTLIAAHAVAAGATLVSNDLAFTRVPSLAFENWAA